MLEFLEIVSKCGSDCTRVASKNSRALKQALEPSHKELSARHKSFKILPMFQCLHVCFIFCDGPPWLRIPQRSPFSVISMQFWYNGIPLMYFIILKLKALISLQQGQTYALIKTAWTVEIFYFPFNIFFSRMSWFLHIIHFWDSLLRLLLYSPIFTGNGFYFVSYFGYCWPLPLSPSQYVFYLFLLLLSFFI